MAERLIRSNPARCGQLEICQLDVPPLAFSHAVPNDPITLEKWMDADGKAFVYCADDDTAYLQLILRDLIPNGVYTIWTIFGLPAGTITPRPMGGLPNTIIASDKGKAVAKRTLNFCPMSFPDDGPVALAMDLAYHSDHRTYGGVPDIPLDGLPGGAVTHVQMEFHFKGEAQ